MKKDLLKSLDGDVTIEDLESTKAVDSFVPVSKNTKAKYISYNELVTLRKKKIEELKEIDNLIKALDRAIGNKTTP